MPAREYVLPIKFVIPCFLFTQTLAAYLRNDGNPALATAGVLAGADSIWFAMPLTELLVAVYVVCMMLRYTKQLATRGPAG